MLAQAVMLGVPLALVCAYQTCRLDPHLVRAQSSRIAVCFVDLCDQFSTDTSVTHQSGRSYCSECDNVLEPLDQVITDLVDLCWSVSEASHSVHDVPHTQYGRCVTRYCLHKSMGKRSNAFKTLHLPSCPGADKAVLLVQGKKSCTVMLMVLLQLEASHGP